MLSFILDDALKVEAESISVSLLHDLMFPNQKRKSTFRIEK